MKTIIGRLQEAVNQIGLLPFARTGAIDAVALSRLLKDTIKEVEQLYAQRFERSVYGLNALAHHFHQKNLPIWWIDPATGEYKERNKGEMISLMHAELSEMLEAERKNLMDDKLPHRRGAEVELADLFIRAFDYAGRYKFDLSGAVVEKDEYNTRRADHQISVRLAPGGKQF